MIKNISLFVKHFGYVYMSVFVKLMNMPAKSLASPDKKHAVVKVFAVLTILVIVIGLYVYQTISPGKAALVVEANTESVVSIDGKDYGKTPLEVVLEKKEVRIRITSVAKVPYSYETKVVLQEDVKTIVRREFGDSEVESAGLIISLEKQKENGAHVVVVSDPDNSVVVVNGKEEGATPLRLSLAPGNHELVLSKINYKPYKFLVNAIEGYTLTAAVDLGREAPLDGK